MLLHRYTVNIYTDLCKEGCYGKWLQSYFVILNFVSTFLPEINVKGFLKVTESEYLVKLNHEQGELDT